MSNPFDRLGRDLAEATLKYDDHNPKHRRELEQYLTRSNQALKTGKVIVKEPIKASVKKSKPVQLEFDFKPKSEPMNIDISLPPELTKLLGGK